MIGDDFRKISRFGSLGDDRGSIRDVLKQRAVRKECAACDKDNPRIGSAIAGKISGRNRAAILQHYVQNNNIRRMFTKMINGLGLAAYDRDSVALPFNMPGPDPRQIWI